MVKQYFEIYKDFWRHYFDVKSCTSRGRFWGAIWWNVVVYLLILGYILAYRHKTGAIFGIFVLVVYFVPNVTPLVTLLVRRFRDVGLSGFWLLITILLPIILLICHLRMANIIMLAGAIINLLITVLPSQIISKKYTPKNN